ncbi:hypothetical protein LCGC14_2299320, partial [marine sediment metagenome]
HPAGRVNIAERKHGRKEIDAQDGKTGPGNELGKTTKNPTNPGRILVTTVVTETDGSRSIASVLPAQKETPQRLSLYREKRYGVSNPASQARPAGFEPPTLGSEDWCVDIRRWLSGMVRDRGA